MTKISAQEGMGRSPYLDNLKGILIALVVFGHFLWAYFGVGFSYYLMGFIYFFHMPGFVFVSGFLSKNENSRSHRSLLKLFVIYVIFNTITMVLSLFSFNKPLDLLTPYYSFWFLLSLITWRVFAKYFDKVKGIIPLSIIFAVMIGIWQDVTNVFAISRTIVFFPFFIIGYKLPYEKLYGFVSSRKSTDYFKGIIYILTAVIISGFFMNFYRLSLSDLVMESYKTPIDLITRIIILSVAGLMTFGLIFLTANKPLPFFCKLGRNSLTVYVLHRFVTFLFAYLLPVKNYNKYYIAFAVFASVMTLLVLGADSVSRIFNDAINKTVKVITNPIASGKKSIVTGTVLILILSLPLLSVLKINKPAKTPNEIHSVLTSSQKAQIDNAVKIAFVGDLILLQDQVKSTYSDKTGVYNFNPMFEYTKKYLSEADLSIGVFEGPMAGKEAGYSTSNYDDGLPIRLNYPDSFAAAVKNSGIDLVSTANNHLLDKGIDGAKRTLDVLDKAGLSHLGSYRNAREKSNIFTVDVKGVKIAVLAYTFGSNGYDESYFLNKNPYLTSILVDPKSKNFSKVKSQVILDIKKIKNAKNPPDLIAVMPHMGTQFIHKTDAFQDTWNNIFISAGADIILGDHSHSVQPIEFRNTNGRQSIIINSPGNFANSYIKDDGDATSIVEVNINPTTKKIVCAGVIPMYTQSSLHGSFRALPIYNILNDGTLKNEISSYEMERVAKVQEIVSSVMLKTKLTVDQAQDIYYLFPKGYFRQQVKAIEITDTMKNSFFYNLLKSSKTVCFVGDSITAGSRNGGYGWYEPLAAAFLGKNVLKEAWDSATTITLLKNSNLIARHKADLYVIAIGTNDVRYMDKKTCAMDAKSYIENINNLIINIQSKNPKAKFVLISPWVALNNDPYTKLPISERDNMLKNYGEELNKYCIGKGFCFINPNTKIYDAFIENGTAKYMIDHIHPNAGDGIRLYSEMSLSN